MGQEIAWNAQLYCSEHRFVEVHGVSLKDHLQLGQRWFVEGPYQIEGDAQIKWNGCLSLHTDQLPQREAVRTVDEILGHLASTVSNAVSPWSILRDLHSPTVTISLGKLESLLRGCPGLATLSCVLSRSGETATYMETLSELHRGPGANLRHLSCKAKGADLCMFARHLSICPLLSVTGTLDWNPHRGVAVPSPIDGAKVVHLFLSIQMPRGWLDSVPGPLDVARYLRRSFLPGSQITIIDSLSECGGDHQKLFRTMLRMTLETLANDEGGRESESGGPSAAGMIDRE